MSTEVTEIRRKLLAIIKGSSERYIGRRLFLSRREYQSRLKHLEGRSRSGTDHEGMWLFLLVYGYLIGNKTEKLVEILSGVKEEGNGIFLEARPINCRKNESNTVLDLALGNIGRRGSSESGIELSDRGMINFCEFKYEADIDGSTTKDIKRNQLERIIETALTFQREGLYASQVVVTLVTPKTFMSPLKKSKLYQYKFLEYEESTENIKSDLEGSRHPINERGDWRYPDIDERLKTLELRWVSLEEILYGMPQGEYRSLLERLIALDGRLFEIEGKQREV